jgi:hypothetical protein
MTDLIGRPIGKLSKFSAQNGLSQPIIAKVEYFNPGAA